MAGLSPAQKLVRVNVVLIVICVVLLSVSIVRGLWVPSVAFGLIAGSNAYQLVTRRR